VQAVPLDTTSLTDATKTSHAHGGKSTMHLLTCHVSVEKGASLLTLAISACQTLLIAGYDDKSIVSWDLTSDNGDAVGFFKLRKKPQNITTARYTVSDASGGVGEVERSVVLISDKFGEVHALNMALTKSEMITGHSTSVITDMVCCRSEDIKSPTTTQSVKTTKTTSNSSSSGSSSSSSSGSNDRRTVADNLLITCDRYVCVKHCSLPEFWS
jgi:hypothetical protein